MRTRYSISVVVAAALFFAACGGSSKPSSSPTTPSGPTTTAHVATASLVNPSVSAKMVCAPEAQKAIYQSATGVHTIAPVKPTWVDHVYACDYVYPGGAKITLSVKELANKEETTAYFDSLATKLTRTTDDNSLGVPAFHVRDGSLVTRKDFKVLLIDVSKLPAKFGVPPDKRADVATNVAETILGCWTGK